jgi:hypothetical protein
MKKSNNCAYLDAGDDGPLLDGGRLLEAVGVNAAEEFLLQVHVVEVLANLNKGNKCTFCAYLIDFKLNRRHIVMYGIQ